MRRSKKPTKKLSTRNVARHKEFLMPPEVFYDRFEITFNHEDASLSAENFGIEVGRRFGYYSHRVIVTTRNVEV